MFQCLRTASTVSFSKQIRVTVKAAAVEKELIYSRPATAPTPALAALQPSPPFHSSGHKDCQTWQTSSAPRAPPADISGMRQIQADQAVRLTGSVLTRCWAKRISRLNKLPTLTSWQVDTRKVDTRNFHQRKSGNKNKKGSNDEHED